MSSRRKSKKKAKRKGAPPVVAAPNEDRSSTAVTVFWMLTALATVATELASLASRLIAHWGPADRMHHTRMFSGMMLLSSLVSGLLVLIVTPVVLRMRAERPPASVTAVVVAIAVSPWLMFGVLAVLAGASGGR